MSLSLSLICWDDVGMFCVEYVLLCISLVSLARSSVHRGSIVVGWSTLHR